MMSTRTLKRLLLSAAVASTFAAGSAQASDNTAVTVNATIIGVCKFQAAPVLNITNTGSGSNIDPSSATTAQGQSLVTYRCTNGTSPVFTVPASATVTCTTAPTCASTTMTTSSLTSANTGAGTGMGAGKDQTLTVTAQINQAGFQNALVGSYQGSIALSVTP
jgi:hypothetical protein